MEDGEAYYINITDLIKVFFHEFLIYQVTHEFLVSQLQILLSNLGFIFLDPEMINPKGRRIPIARF
jgi:hypothetical protein